MASTAVKIGSMLLGRRTVDITLATTGPGFNRLVEPIQQQAKDAAAAIIKERVEAGLVFKQEILDQVTEIRIG
jgi:hypothetical protein